MFNLDGTSATKGCTNAMKIINEFEVGTRYGATTPHSFIERYCTRLQLAPDMTRLAEFISLQIDKQNLIPENTPHAVAAGIVFFIATANRLDTIPAPLRDRMEIIELGGYTEEEKIEIAVRHLVPKQVDEHGLRPSQIAFKREAIQKIVRHYTREAGVRNLEREIGTVTRKVTRRFAEGNKAKINVTTKYVETALGAPRFIHDEVLERELNPGTAVGLAWTPVGGDILFIESAKMPGTRGLIVTGQLGDVMKESITAAMSYARSNAVKLKLDLSNLDKTEIHVHVPAGAVPKDGPSAGVTMLTALTSLFSDRPVKKRLAMTGEITLSGQVLPVGGIKEKVLAAFRAGVETLILPDQNQKDYLEDVPSEIREKLTVHFVKHADQVLKLALEK
jgi:ATP-dependent Lon protease